VTSEIYQRLPSPEKAPNPLLHQPPPTGEGIGVLTQRFLDAKQQWKQSSSDQSRCLIKIDESGLSERYQ
jgi:hypothetical protein